MAIRVYIGLGSDLGDRSGFLEEARRRIGEVDGVEITAVSSLYETEPQDMPSGSPSFLNQVIRIEYDRPPLELLETLERIEHDLGRSDKGSFLPRTIDLDILLFGDEVIKSTRLTVPHRRLRKRPFALIPLLEIDPDLTHPVTGKRLADLVRPKDFRKVELHREHVAREV